MGLEAATGLVPDNYAARQRADLAARIEAFKTAAQEILEDPAAVAAAVAENYAARFKAADALEAAYRSGRADLSVLTEAASIRAEARTELGILGVEEGKVERLIAQSEGHLVPAADPELIEFPMLLERDAIAAQVGMSPSARHLDADVLKQRLENLPEQMEVTARAQLIRLRKA